MVSQIKGNSMNIKQITYFIKIFEFRNMSRAAGALHVAQPALSQQINLLEQDLGVQLFNRSTHGVTPTEQGELLYRHGRTILRQIDNTRDLLISKEGSINGTVSIGMPSSTCKSFAIPLLRRVIERYPGIMLEIVDVPSADLTNLVEQGRVDMAITPNEPARRGLDMQPVLVEELFLITTPTLWEASDAISLDDLTTIPLILPSKPNTLRTSVDQFFLGHHMNYKLVAEASTSSILIAAVKTGIAATVLPWSAVHEEVQADILQLTPLPSVMSRELSLCKAQSLPFTRAAETIRVLCLELFAEMIDHGLWLGAKTAD